MNIYLVRHGESEGNVDPSKYIEKDDWNLDLTKKGEDQAASAGVELRRDIGGGSFRCFHSPYLRATKTKILAMQSLPASEKTSQENPLLVERDWGDVGKHGGVECFDFFFRPEGGESFADAYQRVALFFSINLPKINVDNLVIFGHGEWTRLAVMYLTNQSVEDFAKLRSPKNGQMVKLTQNCCEWEVVRGFLEVRGGEKPPIRLPDGNVWVKG